MAREVNKLTARKVATMTQPGRHADGGGLYLIIDPSGARRWAFIAMIGGKRRELGLGGVAGLPLADARGKALEIRRQIAAGHDPARRRAPKKEPAFGEVAEAFMADHAPSWKSAIHRQQWRQTLTDHAARLWPMPVDKIAVADVLAVLRPLWHTKPETASRLRGRIERIMDAARASGHCTGENPARWRGHLSAMLPPRERLTRGHHAAMAYAECPDFFAMLRDREAVAARMLELLILTVARSNEVRAMEWSEVDFPAAIWIIPGHRMKAKRPHRVPLVPPALAILKERHSPGASGLVFPSDRRRPYTDPVFLALYRRMGLSGFTTHGFRSSFKDWATDQTHHARETIEAALAHVIGDKAEQAYRRTDAIEKRRALLQDWASFLGA